MQVSAEGGFPAIGSPLSGFLAGLVVRCRLGHRSALRAVSGLCARSLFDRSSR